MKQEIIRFQHKDSMELSMGLVVKRVKGKLYVYEQYRVNGRQFTRYIGPLERIVREWQATRVVNSKQGVNLLLGPRVLRRLESGLAGAVVNFLVEKSGGWWTGRDLNPGPLGCQPSNKAGKRECSKAKVNPIPSTCLEITEEMVEDFRKWLLMDNPRLKEHTLRQYLYYIPKLVGLILCGKDDVKKVFEKIPLNKSSYEAFSRFLTFVEKTRDFDSLVAKLRKALPQKPRTRADTWVPSDREVLEARNRVRTLGQPYVLFYNILVSTGCRGTEARYVIENHKRLKKVMLDGYVRLHLPPELQRGSKNEYVLYMPLEVYKQLESYSGSLPNQDTLEKTLASTGVKVKYYRKWWRQKAKEVGIDSEDIEAFQGRVRGIGGRHYTDWIPILDRDYKKVLPKIRDTIIPS